MPTHCTHCGAALPPGSAFCSSCGQPVAPAPAQSAPPPAPSQAPYGQTPPQAPFRPAGPSQGQTLQNLPLLQSLPVGLRLPAVVVAALLVLGALGKMLGHGAPGASGGGGGTSPSAQAGVFSGQCTTEAGKPLANVDVTVTGLTSAGQNTGSEAHSDANGVYTVSGLPPGTYSVANALYPVTFGGTNYNLPLAIPDGVNNDPTDIGPGIVRNLVLHIHGKISPQMPDNNPQSYYGGNVGFIVKGRYLGHGFPDGSITEMTLVPEGPLVDGSTGQTLTLRLVNQATYEGSFPQFNDIPLGQYTMTVRLLNSDGSLVEPMTISPTAETGIDTSGFKPSITSVVFPAGNGSGIGLMQMSLGDGG